MKMKAFVVDSEGNIVDLVFKDEEEADKVFSVILKSRKAFGTIIDNSGKSVTVDASYGYSKSKSELSGVSKGR